ncbi:putative phage transcriptional regulator [Streptococcus pneumoniae]|nr:putative phage transcriptional regulator [Streptococcus pneumoniae]
MVFRFGVNNWGYFSTIESLADEMEVSLADLFKRGEN